MTNEELVNRIQKKIAPRKNMELLYNQTKGLIFEAVKHFEGLADKEDLAQEGFLALSKAAMNYDNSRGMSFASYASKRIKWWMLRYIENDSTIRIPVGICQQIRNYNNVRAKLTHRYRREPSDEEIREAMKLTTKQYNTVVKCRSLGLLESLDETVNNQKGDETPLYEMIPSGEDMEGAVIDQEMAEGLKTALWGAVDELPEKQATVIQKRYQDEKKLGEISEELGLTYRQTQETERQALKWLRSFKYRKLFMPFLPERFGSGAYYGSVAEFQNTWTSSTEKMALKLV